MSDDRKLPEWAPESGGAGFTSEVMKGVEGGHDGMPGSSRAPMRKRKRRKLTVEDYVQGILNNDRTILARAITLIESNSPAHHNMAQAVLKQVQPHAGGGIRVGITGVPGAGKSTFIEALGVDLCRSGKKVAVLAVDPSSSRTGGSILGDKTRMETLTREPNAFIRPSPSAGALGGVGRKSRETMLLCEAAGFDVILVETVGVGQNEVTVRSMVDFFLLVLISGAGDDLQGIKKGVMEIADAILVNKADGDNVHRANLARVELERVVHYLQPATPGWTTPAMTASSVEGDGVMKVWETVMDFQKNTTESGEFDKRRRRQNVDWVHSMIQEGLKDLFYHHPAIYSKLPNIENEVADGQMPATTAVEKLLEEFKKLTLTH
jgi:LAO/AO transport system kinase